MPNDFAGTIESNGTIQPGEPLDTTVRAFFNRTTGRTLARSLARVCVCAASGLDDKVRIVVSAAI